MFQFLSGRILVVFVKGTPFSRVEEIVGSFQLSIMYRPQNHLHWYHIAVPTGKEIHWAGEFEKLAEVKYVNPIGTCQPL